MNVKRIFGILVLALMIGFFSSVNVFAKGINGNFCFTVHVTEHEDGPCDETVTVAIHFKTVDSSSVIMTGTQLAPDQGTVFLSGIGRIVGDEIIFGVNFTHNNSTWGEKEGGIMQIALDRNTLTGSFWMIQLGYSTTSSFQNYYSAGTMTKLPKCPK